MAQKKFHSKASRFLYNRYIAGDPKREEEYEEEVINAEIARKIYDLRTRAGLTQQELAERVGTSKSAICRLEDADYEGHSLSMLKRIAEALDKRIEIRFLLYFPQSKNPLQSRPGRCKRHNMPHDDRFDQKHLGRSTQPRAQNRQLTGRRRQCRAQHIEYSSPHHNLLNFGGGLGPFEFSNRPTT